MNKPHRSICFAEKFSVDQRNQLYSWLNRHTLSEVAKLIAAPPPDGFGIEISISTLSRFAQAHQEDLALYRAEEREFRMRLYRYSVADRSIYSRWAFDDASIDLLQEEIFGLLDKGNHSAIDLQRIARLCQVVRDLDHKQRSPGEVLLSKVHRKSADHEIRQKIAESLGDDPNQLLSIERYGIPWPGLPAVSEGEVDVYQSATAVSEDPPEQKAA